MIVAHRVLDHTADTGIEAKADTLSRLVEELATAMFGLIGPVSPESARHWVEVAVSSSSVEDLVVDVLSELLYRSEIEGVTFGAFRATISTEGHSATVQAGGVPNEEVDTTGPPIKAVTYHDLVVREHEDGWYGRVYLDV